jgi:hypothetical protein
MSRTKIFNGKKYEICGSSPTTKPKLEKWADFQRRVNGNLVRIVKNTCGSGYEAYMRKG